MLVKRMLIGRRLREIRESKNLSQVTLSSERGCGERASGPPVATLQKMARALEVPLHRLFHDGKSPVEKPALSRGENGHDKGNLWGSQAHERDKLQLFAKVLARMTDRQRNLLMASARNMAK